MNTGSLTTPPTLKRIVIKGLLLEGHSASKIAKMKGISRQAVAKYIQRLVEDKEIRAVKSWPVQYVKVIKETDDNPPPQAVPNDNPINTGATMLPHHYGGVFSWAGKPPFQFNRFGHFKDIHPAYTGDFGRHYKAQIWIKSFMGADTMEVRRNAFRSLQAQVRTYERQYGLKMTLLHLHKGAEWAMVDQELSDSVAAANGLKKNQEMLVDGVRHKNGDSSHSTMEYIPTAANPNGADAHADANHFVYSGKLAQTLSAIGDAIITINQRVMALEERKR